MTNLGKASPETVVRAEGLTSNDLRMQLVVAVMTPVALTAIVFLTIGGPSTNTSVKVGIAVTVLAACELLLEGGTSVRGVTVSSSGVSFKFPFHTDRLAWSEVAPSGVPVHREMWQVMRTASSGRRPRSYHLTKGMTLAILRHPSRPEWTFTPDEQASLAT